MKNYIILFFLVTLLSCKKDTIELPDPDPIPVIATKYKVKFVFVNRIGFRNDSTRHGLNDTVFQGPCLDGKFYDKEKNTTTLSNTCFNRNFSSNNFPVTDSIIFDFGIYDCTIGSKYGYQIEMVWKCPTYPYTTKILRYTTKNYIEGDTIKVLQDYLIKFIWPIDTSSGKFIKTYQWPM